MRAVIIGNGSILDYDYIRDAAFGNAAVFSCGGVLSSVQTERGSHEDCIIICADGGAEHAKRLGVTPSVIVGDLDSISAKTLEYYEEMGVPFEKYPPAKDLTDTEIALLKAFDEGADEITLIAVTGERADHSLANLGLLDGCLKHGVSAVVLDDNNIISLVGGKTELITPSGQTVSLIPFTDEVAGITTDGLLYPLKNESLARHTARGVSNICENGRASVDFASGKLLVILARL